MAPPSIFTAATLKPQDLSLTTSCGTHWEPNIYVHADAAARREPTNSHNTTAAPPHHHPRKCKHPFSWASGFEKSFLIPWLWAKLEWKSTSLNDTTDRIHKCHNALAPYPTMHILFWMAHCGIWDRCIMGFMNQRTLLSVQSQEPHVLF